MKKVVYRVKLVILSRKVLGDGWWINPILMNIVNLIQYPLHNARFWRGGRRKGREEGKRKVKNWREEGGKGGRDRVREERRKEGRKERRKEGTKERSMYACSCMLLQNKARDCLLIVGLFYDNIALEVFWIIFAHVLIRHNAEARRYDAMYLILDLFLNICCENWEGQVLIVLSFTWN